jgi:hypothetical protein
VIVPEESSWHNHGHWFEFKMKKLPVPVGESPFWGRLLLSNAPPPSNQKIWWEKWMTGDDWEEEQEAKAEAAKRYTTRIRIRSR